MTWSRRAALSSSTSVNRVPPLVGAIDQQLTDCLAARRAPGSRVRSAGIPLRSSIATRASTWVDSRPLPAFDRNKAAAGACRGARSAQFQLPQIMCPATVAIRPNGPMRSTSVAAKWRFDRLQIRDGDDDLAEMLALLIGAATG